MGDFIFWFWISFTWAKVSTFLHNIDSLDILTRSLERHSFRCGHFLFSLFHSSRGHKVLWVQLGCSLDKKRRFTISVNWKSLVDYTTTDVFVFLTCCVFFSDSIQRVHKASSKEDHRTPQSVSALGLLRLDPSTEQALIGNAPPGHITFTLLVEALSEQEAVKSPLIQAYADVVHRYSG